VTPPLLHHQINGISVKPVEPGDAADVGSQNLCQFKFAVAAKGRYGKLVPPAVASPHRWARGQSFSGLGINDHLRTLLCVTLGDNDLPLAFQVAVPVRVLMGVGVGCGH
jgi:hypothetical protein